MSSDSRLLVDEVASDLHTVNSTLSAITSLSSSINDIALYGRYTISDAEELKKRSVQLKVLEKEAKSVLKRVEQRARQLDERENKLDKQEDDLRNREVELSHAMRRLKAREETIAAKEKQWEELESSQDVDKRRLYSYMKEEAEKKLQKYVDETPNVIKLNVGGEIFSVEKRLIMSFPHSLLAFMVREGRFNSKQEVFIDRDHSVFPKIINVLRGSTRTSIPILSDEYKFWFQNDVIFNHPLVSFNSAIVSWLPKTFSMLYNSASDGLSVSKFHSLCDNKGPTLCVIRSGEYLFGGYNMDHWQSPERPITKHLPDSFIFTLTNPHGIPPTQYWPLIHTTSITQHKDNGIIFGDLYGTGLLVSGDSKSVHIEHPGAFIDTTAKRGETFTGQAGRNPIGAIFVYSVK